MLNQLLPSNCSAGEQEEISREKRAGQKVRDKQKRGAGGRGGRG